MNDQCSVFCGRSCGGQCASCPWGWSANPPHIPGFNKTQSLSCQPCGNGFTVYDWLFVAFHVLAALLLHYQAIWRLSVTRWRGVAAEYASATVEVCGGFMLTILAFPPFGSVWINACYSASLIQQDINQYWYNSFPDGYYILMPSSIFFFDPFHDKLDATWRCFYEIIYPRFSLPLIGLCLSLIITVTLRPIVLNFCSMHDTTYQKMPYLYKALSSTLVAYPMYTLVVSVLGGFIYKYYAYLLLLAALLCLSFYAAYASNQKYTRLITSSDRLIHIPFILWHFLLLAASAWSYVSSETDNMNLYSIVFPLTLVPFAFLFLTDDITNAQTARVESNPGTDLKEHVKVARTMIDSDDNGESNRGVGGGGGFSGFIIDHSASQPRTEDSYPPRRNFQQQTAHN